MEVVCAFSVAKIICVIGHVKMGKSWGIVDRNFGPLWVQELEYKSEDDFSISCGV
jgi:hypothetical protein